MTSSTQAAFAAEHPGENQSIAVPSCLKGAGEACALARALDWGRTSIGPVDGWSQALRSAASLVLHNHSPMLLWWGADFVQIYNDAYRPVLGDKHPRAMGQPFRDCWSEVFHILGPMAERPFRGGPASVSDDIAVLIDRSVPHEETHFRLAYSPVPDETVESGIGGVLATVEEISEQVFANRQIRTLRELGAHSPADLQTAEQAGVSAIAVLKKNPWDVPFALLYLFDGHDNAARLVASTGLGESALAELPPATATPGNAQGQDPWQLKRLVADRDVLVIPQWMPDDALLARSPWNEPVRSAIVLPLATSDQSRMLGALVCGLSPHRVLNADYRTFFDLTASQVVAAIRGARALEEERNRAEALATIDRAKTVFFSNVSHEFRTPLTLLLGPLADVSTDATLPEAVRAQLALAHRNALRLLRLVNTLLDFSRIEAGRAQATFEPTDLTALTQDLASTFRSLIERGGLAYRVDCAPIAKPAQVDRQMWEKIVLNLLSNAFKYTLHGEISVRLYASEDAYVILEIRDTGSGIPENELPHIFERFHRVEGTRGRSQEGTGIGLSLVQELVRLHGGEISATSTLGVGTTITVRIPIRAALVGDGRADSDSQTRFATINAGVFVEEALRWIPGGQSNTATSPAGILPDAVPVVDAPRYQQTDKPRVLVADDNADMRAYLQKLLASSFSVEVAENGVTALEAATRELPDLVVADIMMPRLDGIGLVRAMRADEQLLDVPVILLSARAGEEARVEGLQSGADDYMVKPFSARELIARMDSLLELRALRRRSDERFRALINASSDAVYAMNADWSEMRFLEGKDFVTSTDNVSATWLDYYVPPEDRDDVLAHINAAIRDKSPFELEHHVRRVDGSTGWTLSRAIPVLDKHGEIVEWFGMAVDMTERKRVEVVLKDTASWLTAQKEAFRTAVDDAPLTVSLGILSRVVTAQVDGGAGCAFYLANAEQTELRQVVGTSQDVPSDAARYRISADAPACGLAAYQGRPVFATEPAAAPHEVRSSWSFPIETSSGKVVGAFTIYPTASREPDHRERELAARLAHSAALIIARYQQSEERAQVTEALRIANRQKDEFLAMLAHELRNPLAPITNASELLARTLAGSTETRLIDMIKRQTAQLTRLVDDLLDVSRITQGHITLQREPLDVAVVVAQSVETVEPRLRQLRHTLTVESTSGGERLYVDGDMARLVQCVSNILANAVKYTDPGGTIHIWTRPEGANVVIGVTDNGSGIAPDLLAHVFDLFVQSERTLDRAQGGLGIGLAVVKRLVEMHGGMIAAHSAGVGHGSAFEIRLPRVSPPPSPKRDADADVVHTRRVMVVDDNRDAADSLSTLLALQGHTLEVAYDAEEAIRCAATFLPEVVLLDIGLPGMDGYELAQTLRKMPRLQGVYLVAITGYGQPEDYRRTRDAGFDEHLVKPVNPEALQRALSASRAA
ncbi:ATP-binding protein [Cupriavidus pauculus]|uniref:ATP-binding protein n=1 Tax=Cupriavidus pauculus TaxID=82633 RepID=UPI0015DDADE0|nr:ATP-binding protein [Cupriavidus pauculus]